MPEPDTTPDATAWYTAVASALTGETLTVDALTVDAGNRAVSAPAITTWLGDLGWTPDRLAAHRAACRDAGAPWPHPVPASLLGPGTAARLHSLVVEVRSLTGTSGLVATQRPEQRALTADDRRLLAEVPPHHGNV